MPAPPSDSAEMARLKATYDQDGFVVLRSWFSEEEVEEARQAAAVATVELAARAGWMGVTKALEYRSGYFRGQLRGGRHLPLVEALVGGALAPSSAAYFSKPSTGAVDIGPHSDSTGQRDGATLWVALDRADLRNGCLCYLRGSHLRTHPQHALLAPAGDVMALESFRGIDESAEDAWHFIAEPGDAVVHSSYCVHFSRKPPAAELAAGTARPHQQRRAISFFYWAADSPDLADAPGSHAERLPRL
jgi:hypothetical protein